MERSTELMSSAGSGSYGVTQTENEDTLSEGGDNNSEETLNLVEGAILRTLQKHSQEVKRAGEAKNAGAAADEERGSAQAPAKSSNPEDMELLAHLLEQVHDLRRNQRQKPSPPEAQENLRPASRRRGRSRKPSEELRMALEAATMAAKAAAEAAEAAALAVARNTEAIELIMEKKKQRKKSKSKISDEEAIVRSNQRTHWILGFTAITTIAWRFGVVKVAKRVAGKLNDPLGYVGGLMGNNDDEKAVEKSAASAAKGNLLDKLPHIDIPEFLPNPSDHGKETKPETASKAKEKEKEKETSFLAKSATAVDVKTKEVEKTAFSFANLLHIRPKEN